MSKNASNSTQGRAAKPSAARAGTVVHAREGVSSYALGSRDPVAISSNFLTKAKKLRFAEIYRAQPLDIVVMVKCGLPAESVIHMADEMNSGKEWLLHTLSLPQSSINRKVREHKRLSSDETSKVLGIARLVGQVQTMVEESGNPEGFNAADWLATWLKTPLAALGNTPPSAIMDTSEGQAIVSNLLARVQSGAYA
jgi:putative toxin-antitoxin system antitoxin component (TIGR02293 family)